MTVKPRSRKKFHTIIYLVAGLTALACNAFANATGLEWNAKSAELTAALQDVTAEAWFTATNTSGSPVEIISVKSDCGCVSALLDRQTVYPGESTTVIATIELDPHVGPLEKNVTLRSETQGQDAQSTVLQINVMIESPVDIETIPGGPDGSTRFHIRASTELPIRLEIPPTRPSKLTLIHHPQQRAWTAVLQKNDTKRPNPTFLAVHLAANRIKRIPLPLRAAPSSP